MNDDNSESRSMIAIRIKPQAPKRILEEHVMPHERLDKRVTDVERN